MLAVRFEFNVPINGIPQINLPLDDVIPRWCQRVFAIRHKDFGTRIQRIDDHFAVGGAGNLDAPVCQVGRYVTNLPGRVLNLCSWWQKVGHLTRVDFFLPVLSLIQQFGNARAKLPA